MTPTRIVIVAVLLLGALTVWSRQQPPLLPAGPFPEPVQTSYSSARTMTAPPGYRMIASDDYDIQALVVSVRRYRRGQASELSPVDFVLAWGPITQDPTLSRLRFSQSDRWFNVDWGSDEVTPPDVIMRSCANTHIIPAWGDEGLRDRLMAVRRGARVRLKGYLIQIFHDSGFHWLSSRSRTDSGAGSCEVLYVTGLEAI